MVKQWIRAWGLVACAATVGIGAQQPRSLGGVTLAHFEAFDSNGDGAITRDEMRNDVRQMVHEVGYREGRWADAGAGVRGRQRRVPTLHARRRAAAESDARLRRRRRDDGRVARCGTGEATAAAEGARPRPGVGLRPLVDPAGGAHHRGDRQEDRRVDDDDHVRRGRHQRRQPETVRRHLPGDTTGEFLDDPADAAATAARRKALLDFVRGGKGLAGIHAATDGYHRNSAPGAGPGMNLQLLPAILQLLEGDRNGDGRLTRESSPASRMLVREARHRQERPRGPRGVSQRYAAVVGPPRSIGQRFPPQGPVEEPRSRYRGRHLARVQPDDRGVS